MDLKDLGYTKECFGKNNCWGNVRAKCLVSIECRMKSRAEALKKVDRRNLGSSTEGKPE